MNKIFLFSFLIFFTLFGNAQNKLGLSYGGSIGLQFNTAILPDIKINNSINSVLEGEDVAKGVPQWADMTLNYTFGGFIKHNHGFGFAQLALNYTTTKIRKDIRFTTGDFFGNNTIKLSSLERDFSYLDIALSYNIYLSDKFYWSLGVTPSFLLSHTGSQTPKKTDFRVFSGFGIVLNEKITVTTQVELGLSEVYEGSYIHHLMIPLGLHYTF